MPVKAVTFDLWLTLIWDSKELEEYRKLRRLINFYRFANRIHNGHSEKVGLSDVRLAMNGMTATVKDLYERGFDVSPADRGKMLFDSLGIRVKRNEERDAYDRAGEILSSSGYIHKFPNVNPEAKPALKALKETFPGLKVALISNAARSARTYARTLQNLGIAEYFDNYVISCEVGFLKPRKEIFERALSLLSVSPKEALHIGDLFRADVVGATGSGMNAALYTGLWHKYHEYMAPGEHIPEDFKAKTVVEEIPRLQDAVDVAQRIK